MGGRERERAREQVLVKIFIQFGKEAEKRRNREDRIQDGGTSFHKERRDFEAT